MVYKGQNMDRILILDKNQIAKKSSNCWTYVHNGREVSYQVIFITEKLLNLSKIRQYFSCCTQISMYSVIKTNFYSWKGWWKTYNFSWYNKN